MKKTSAWILALAMLSTSAMALAENTPPQMAHAAKSILKKTGSGKLTPTKRQRRK